MSANDLLKIIGLDIASVGIVVMPAECTLPVVEDQIEFAIKVFVGLTAAAMNITVYLNARKKKNKP